MKVLNENVIINLEDGRKAKVLDVLGSGGQGTVYAVEIDGERYAMKWYAKAPSEAFRQNLMKNVEEGSPSPMFLWPQAVTRIRFDSYGYIMPLKPDGYYEFTEFRLAKVRFRSMRAVITAAILTCEAFRQLHAKGLSYQDLNDGGFFINPVTGQVMICDCDNVFPHGEQSGILGKARYIAPEVVRGESMPNSYSDRFSMVVLLFMFFCIDHPLEGRNVVRYPCLTEDIERKLFGEQPCFIYDSDDASNRPVSGVHHNAINLWKLLPDKLHKAFCQELGKEKIMHPEQRMTEMEWIDMLIAVRDSLVRCPHCGDEAFIGDMTFCLNRQCRMDINVPLWLVSDTRHIPLIDGNMIFIGKKTRPVGRVVTRPDVSGMLIMQNISDDTWQLTTPSGKSKNIDPKSFFPVKEGMRLSVTMEDGMPAPFIVSSCIS